MLEDILQANQIFIACGPTDFRKAIDGLAAIVSAQFKLDPFSKSIYLFCNRKKDKIKAWMQGIIILPASGTEIEK